MLVSLVSLAILAPAGTPISLSFAPKVGSTLKFHFVASTVMDMHKGVKAKATREMVLTFKVTDTDAKGTSGVLSVSGFKMTDSTGAVSPKAAAELAKQANQLKANVKFAKNGTVLYAVPLNGKADPTGAGEMSVASTFEALYFPTKKVKSGDTWERVEDMGKKLQSMSHQLNPAEKMYGNGVLTTKYKLSALANAPKVGQVAKIVTQTNGVMKTVAEGWPMATTIRGGSEITVIAKTGVPVKVVSSQASVTTVQDKTFNQTATLNLELIP